MGVNRFGIFGIGRYVGKLGKAGKQRAVDPAARRLLVVRRRRNVGSVEMTDLPIGDGLRCSENPLRRFAAGWQGNKKEDCKKSPGSSHPSHPLTVRSYPSGAPAACRRALAVGVWPFAERGRPRPVPRNVPTAKPPSIAQFGASRPHSVIVDNFLIRVSAYCRYEEGSPQGGMNCRVRVLLTGVHLARTKKTAVSNIRNRCGGGMEENVRASRHRAGGGSVAVKT